MLDHLKQLPNQLTATRLLLVIVMWIFAWNHLPVYIGIGIFICFVTDVLDGYFARKLHQESDFGSKFDSFADHLLLPSGLIWLWLFRPEVYRENIEICALTIIIYLSSLLLGIIKFRRFANLHLISSKISAVFLYLFLSYTLLINAYNPVFFYLASGTFLLSRAEGLLLQLVSSQVDARTGSILFLRKSRSH